MLESKLHPSMESHANNVLNWFRNELIACAAQYENILPNYYNNNSLKEEQEREEEEEANPFAWLENRPRLHRPAASSHKP